MSITLLSRSAARAFSFRSMVYGAGFALLVATSYAETITLQAGAGGKGDAYNESSFNSGLNWSGGQAPSAGNDYLVIAGALLRTPPDNSNYTFLGDSLELRNSGSTLGQLSFKGGSDRTITIADLRLNGGSVANSAERKNLLILEGGILLSGQGGQFRVDDVSRGIVVNATISGTGPLWISPKGDKPAIPRYVQLNASNTFSGTTTVEAQLKLDANGAGSLGLSNVIVEQGAQLRLGSVTALNQAASLILGVGLMDESVDLDFVGTSSVSSITIGGTTYTGAGTYGAIGSGASQTFSEFMGTGLLGIPAIPEPSAAALVMGLSGLILGSLARRRR